MGQELSLQQNSQQVYENSEGHSTTSNQEGLLKISAYPFPQSMRLSSSGSGMSMYAQKCKNLQQDISHRKAHKQYYSKAQIIDFIESVVYRLVSFQRQGTIYKDISSLNVFVVQEKSKSIKQQKITFKLLPNHLIVQSTYQRLQRINKRVVQHQKCFTFSPQMIIALRAREKKFNDFILLKKSTVFALGIVLLQAATLKLSCEFYDTVSFDIYEEVIEKCLSDTEERYGSAVVRMIANMVDFDFDQRIQGFTELAKWIIYEIQNLNDPNLQNTSNHNIPSTSKVSLNKAITISQRSLNHQNFQTLPVCLETNHIKKQKLPIQPISKPQTQKQNIQTQNKINIKVRQVSVYLEKNSHLQNDNQNNARLFYSPFLSTSSDGKSDYEYRENSKVDLVKQYSRRGLAFQQTTDKMKRNYFVQSLTPLSNYLRTHR